MFANLCWRWVARGTRAWGYGTGRTAGSSSSTPTLMAGNSQKCKKHGILGLNIVYHTGSFWLFETIGFAQKLFALIYLWSDSLEVPWAGILDQQCGFNKCINEFKQKQIIYYKPSNSVKTSSHTCSAIPGCLVDMKTSLRLFHCVFSREISGVSISGSRILVTRYCTCLSEIFNWFKLILTECWVTKYLPFQPCW